MANFQDPFGIGTGIGSYYQGALANDPRLPAINRNISGQVAPDVRNQIAQAAAERGVGIGSYGAGNDQSAFLRALGLTSMDLTNKGIGQYGEAYNAVPQLRPGELFVNPTDESQMKLQQSMQTERLNSEAGLQASRLASAENMQSRGLAQDASQFGINREDTKSGVAATGKKLDDMLSRLTGGSSKTGVNTFGDGSTSEGGKSGASWYEDQLNQAWVNSYSPDYSGGYGDYSPTYEDQLNQSWVDEYNLY